MSMNNFSESEICLITKVAPFYELKNLTISDQFTSFKNDWLQKVLLTGLKNLTKFKNDSLKFYSVQFGESTSFKEWLIKNSFSDSFKSSFDLTWQRGIKL